MLATLILTPVPGLHALTIAEVRALGDQAGLSLDATSTPGGVLVSSPAPIAQLSALLAFARSVRAAALCLSLPAPATLAALEADLRALAPQLGLPPGVALDVRLEGPTGLPEPPQEVAQRLGEALLGDLATPAPPAAPLEVRAQLRDAALELHIQAPWSPDAAPSPPLERHSNALDTATAFALLSLARISSDSAGLLLDPFGADDSPILRVAAGLAPQLRCSGLALEEGQRLADRCDPGAVDCIVTHPPQSLRLKRPKNAEELHWKLLADLSHALRIGGLAAFTTPTPAELQRMLRRFPELKPLELHTTTLRNVPLTLCALEKIAHTPEGRLRGLVGKSRRG